MLIAPQNLAVPLAKLFLLSAFAVLALDPLLWLLRSWSLPGYDSPGALVFALVAALFAWSACSPLRAGLSQDTTACLPNVDPYRLPLALLAASFGIRLAGQLLGISLLGALMLVIDVFALGLLMQLRHRRRSLSPLFLAGLFCFALPLEPLLQRSLGFLLQQASASGACSVLDQFYESVRCEGVRIVLDGVDVLVDLPCSGARLMILLLTAFFALGAFKPLAPRKAFLGFFFTLFLAWLANTGRILLLAVGLRHESSTGIEVMLDPWHSGIGLAVQGLGVLALLWWFHCQAPVGHLARRSFVCFRDSRASTEKSSRDWRGKNAATVACALAFLFLALKLTSITATPLDVSRPLADLQLPLSLGGVAQQALPLSDEETRYFITYGGTAARAAYGNNSLLMVRTTSPLRHLHTPDVCFSAAGHEVTYLGADFSAGAVALYRSRSMTGDDLRVRVRFVSDSGRVVHSISEVVWHWVRQPKEAWTMVQTVSPWDAPADEFNSSVGRNLNLNS